MPPYLRMARWCLEHRKSTLALAVLFFIGSLALLPLLSKGFVPPDDNSQTQIYLQLPPGATLAETSEKARQAYALALKNPYVQHVYTAVGGGAAGGDPFGGNTNNETRKAVLTLQLAPRGERPDKKRIEQQLREALESIPGIRSKVGLGGSGEKFQLALTGTDPVALAQVAKALEREMRAIPGVGNVDSSAALTRSEVHITPDLDRAAALGVTPAAIADTLRVATQGDYERDLPKLNLPTRQTPIVVRMADTAYASERMLERLPVKGSRGPVLLGQVAQISYGGGPSVLERMDRERSVTFNAELAGIALGDMQEQVRRLPSLLNLPPTVKERAIGDAEASAEMAEGFALAMATGVLCIYLVLVLLFHAFWSPLAILAVLPLSFGGAFVLLLITGKMLAMPSLIGLLMLMGVSTKNSILLVDYAVEAQRRGLSRFEAVLDACSKRARPILMTSVAMGAGMLPAALGSGSADPSFRSPMAVAVIGGLVTSTLLSLLVIPPVYTLVDDGARALRRRWQKLLHLEPGLPAEAAPPSSAPLPSSR